MTLYAALLALGLCAALVRTSDADETKSKAVSDQTFVTKAAKGGLAEVNLGRIAMQRASNPEVKQFGQRMVTDHTKANQELIAIANKKSIKLPPTMSKEDEMLANKLAASQGSTFDQMYMKHMVEDHKKDVALFENQAQHGQDADIKAFASKCLPTLREHLKMAEQVCAKVEGSQK
jgi:putative membrane protein